MAGWPGVDMVDGVPVVINCRPGRGRPRQTSDHPHQQMYLMPGAGFGAGRSNSMSGPRPNQIVFNNNQWEDRSPSRDRRRSHGRSPFEDDWDERAHSPRRHRSRSRERSRDSRRYSPHYDLETERKMKKLEELERKEEEEAARERAKQEIIIAEAKAAKRRKEEEQIRKAAVEEYEREKHEKKMKEQKKKEEEEKAFRKRLKEMYLSQGYSEDSIDIMIEEGEKKKHHHHRNSHSDNDGALVPVTKITDVKVMDLRRPTFIKVHRKHLSPETLDAYNLPWEWDDRDSSYMLIKRWVSEHDQDILFEHTRKIREGRLLTNQTVELRKERDQLLLVRHKSPKRERSKSRNRAFLFT